MKQKRILAVASQGGHWRQLQEMSHAFVAHDVTFVSTSKEGDYCVMDCNGSRPWVGVLTAIQLLWITLKTRPDVVISTGALPGFIALVIARLFKARTVWIDSIANAEDMSLSGRLSRPLAELWLTQWPNVSARTGATYVGAVL